MFRLVAILVLTISIASPAFAANVYHSSTLRSVQQLADGRVVLRFMEDSTSCTNANSPRYYYISNTFNGMTPDGVKNSLGVALSAMTTGREVAIMFDAASSGCYINSIMML